MEQGICNFNKYCINQGHLFAITNNLQPQMVNPRKSSLLFFLKKLISCPYLTPNGLAAFHAEIQGPDSLHFMIVISCRVLGVFCGKTIFSQEIKED